MGKHRSRLNILANVLSVINNNKRTKKTQIMYKAYLSYKLLVQYLDDVIQSGLVVFNDGYYKLTEKGALFLTRFDEYTKSREIIDEHMLLMQNQRLILDELCHCCELSSVDSKVFGRSLSHK